MSEQKFEQQVRQVMDEFSLSPTAPVWHKIAAEIKRKKDRRRIILWLLPMVLLSSAIIWWTITNEKRSNSLSQKEETINQNKNRPPINNLNTSITTATENIQTKATSKKEKSRANQEKIKTTFKKTTFPGVTITKKTKTKIANKKIAYTSDYPIKKEKISSEVTPVLTKEKFYDNATKIENAIKPPPPAQDKNLIIVQQKDTVQDIKQQEQKRADPSSPSDQLDEQKLKGKKNKKLQFEGVVQVGFTGITSGLLDGFGPKSAQDFSASSPLQSAPGGSNNLPPSNIKKGFSYSIGFAANKKISTRSTISLGLQYQYYSTRINVGTRSGRDSTLNNVSRDAANYYRNNNYSKHYTNQFHFITLPLSYDYQLFKKFPLHIGTGLQLSQLISSNALHYNSAANIYYNDNSLLNKTQLGLFTNLTYTLWRQKKLFLNVGPQFNYGLTPLQKTNSSKKQHLFFMGVNTQFRF
jgi:hypothetical protein